MSVAPSPSDDVVPAVAGYTVGRAVHRDAARRVHRATSPKGVDVVVTFHATPTPTELQLASVRHGYGMARRLDGVDGVVGHLDLVPTDRDLALVTEIVTGARLLRTRLASAMTLADICTIGESLARAIANVHRAGVLHGALSPSAVLVDPAGGCHLLELSRATDIEATSPAIDLSAGHVDAESDLAYVSPEQTGRTNRPVDARSDLYRIGVVLFEMLTGRTPFVAETTRALVHAHIARRPPLVDRLRPGTPRLLVELVDRLLAKDPEQRYATADAVASDLARIGEALAQGETPSFALGADDVSGTLRLSDVLVGRDRELARLLSAYDEVAAGASGLVYVSGYSGSGKSRLVNELQRPVARHDGWFTTGKFDLYRRDLPYAAWLHVVDDLVHQILTLPTDELEQLRADLVRELRGSAAALVEFAPGLELLLGPQGAPADASPSEAQRRLEAGLRTLVQTLASADHPLLVFVDDLQWTDLASLRLLDLLVSDESAPHVLIVLAWRDNEVDGAHPAADFLERHRDAATDIAVEPLDVPDLAEWLVLTFGDTTSRGDVDDFAKLLHAKTEGNPFFSRRFLIDLAVDGALTLDQDSRSWVWDTEAIEHRQVSENVGDVVAAQLHRLPAATHRMLQVASCIGPEFELGVVADLAGVEQRRAAVDLHAGLASGVIVPLDDRYRLAAESDGVGDVRYGFLHDRVQEAAHRSMGDEQRATVHHAVAKHLLDHLGDDGDHIVEVSSHLAAAITVIDADEDRHAAADVLVRGGARAKAVMASEAARRFLDAADDLLPADRWTSAPVVARRLHVEAADLAYIDGRFDDIDEHAEVVLAHSSDPLERMPIHNIRVGVGIARNEWAAATEYAVRVLADDYAIELPLRPSLATVAAELARLRWELRSMPIERLRALPPMTDPNVDAAMTLLMKTATNAYWASPNLVPLIGFTMVRQTVRHGTGALSAYGYVLYGLVLSSVLFDAHGGQRFGQLAMETIDRTGARHLYGKTALIADGFIRHGLEPLADTVPLLLDAFHEARAAGDIENTAYCAMAALYNAVTSGEPLDRVADRLGPYTDAVHASGHAQTIYGTSVWQQAVDNLRSADGTSELRGDHIDFEARLAELIDVEDGNAIPQGVCAAGFLAVLMDDEARAERHLGLLFANARNTPGQGFLVPCLGLYGVMLSRRRASGRLGPTDRAKLTAIIGLLRRRTGANPHDHEPFLSMIAAERAAARDHASAADRFVDAAELAGANGFTYLEGLALERASEMHDRRGRTDLARHLLDRAVAVWRRYGANARLRLLGYEASHADRSSGVTDSIDVATLLDTAAAVSREIEVDAVIGRVLELALENAGARRGIYARVADGVVEVRAVATSGDDGSVTVQHAVDDGTSTAHAHWARSVADYALRTDRDLIVGDAVGDPLFERDPYVRERRVPSILCAPIHRGGVAIGVLYLENDLGPHVFTERHLAVARSLAGQAAISIENAELYERQRSQAQAFSRFVPRAFLENLDRDSIIDVELGDAVEADVTILFSDLRDFTTLSEQMTPEDNFDLLNNYLELMEPAIDAHGGFIDKYIGDAVMALFTGGADGAIDAAVAMTTALERFNHAHPGRSLRQGIGIHAGTVMLGTIGSRARMETTVIGDTVNTASRIEGLTKEHQARVLVSDAVIDRLREPGRFGFDEVGAVHAKGKTEPVTIHRLVLP